MATNRAERCNEYHTTLRRVPRYSGRLSLNAINLWVRTEALIKSLSYNKPQQSDRTFARAIRREIGDVVRCMEAMRIPHEPETLSFVDQAHSILRWSI
jgi:hypothetical protein